MGVKGRSREQIAAHYMVERELAQRLRDAPASERAHVYGEVYDELFQKVTDHPQLTITPAQRAYVVAGRLRFVKRFLRRDSCLMEIGAGDCAFSIQAAPFVRRVVAVDVSEVITAIDHGCTNLDVVLSDGTSIPAATGSIDVAFSDQLMEHLHPDDALAQLGNVHRALKAGGIYICITPNRLTGPHDASRAFDKVASGFHLREYSARDLREIFVRAGFTRVDFYVGGRGHYLRTPAPLVSFAETLLERLPARVRRRVGDSVLAAAVFGVNAIATR